MGETILHQWFRRVWTEGDRSAVDDLLAEHAVIHELNEHAQDSHGRAEFLVFFDRFRAAMPDSRIEVHDVVEAGDRIAGRWTATATHAGDSLGFPATNRPIRVSGMSMARIENGQIAEGWNIWDRLGLMQQLGFDLAPAIGTRRQ
jgi:steroid delta-isomerase-like uncharacterized protein